MFDGDGNYLSGKFDDYGQMKNNTNQINNLCNMVYN